MNPGTHSELTLLRESDPLRQAAAATDPGTEAAWRDLLARVAAKHSAAPEAFTGRPRPARWSRRRLRRRGRPRTLGLGALGSALVAAGVAAVVISALPSGGPVQVSAAQAKLTLARAADVLLPHGNAVIHSSMTTMFTNSAHPRPRFADSYETWQQTARPYDLRSISRFPGRRGQLVETEQAVVDGRGEDYDSATNTVYANEIPPLLSGAVRRVGRAKMPGHYVIYTHFSGARDHHRLTVTAAQLKALRDGKDFIMFDGGTPTRVASYASAIQQEMPHLAPTPWIARIRALLRSPQVTVQRNVTFDHRPAIRILTHWRPVAAPTRTARQRRPAASKPGSRTVYYIDPRTYAPLELIQVQRSPSQPAAGSGGGIPASLVITRFNAYKRLPATPKNLALTSLTGAHPHATVNRSRTAALAFEQRQAAYSDGDQSR